MFKRIIKPLIFVIFVLQAFLSTAQSTDKPLILPMQEPASPSTWLLGQPYGNTRGAFRNADRWYSAGQGLHFGLDFSMPCGTTLVAAAVRKQPTPMLLEEVQTDILKGMV